MASKQFTLLSAEEAQKFDNPTRLQAACTKFWTR